MKIVGCEMIWLYMEGAREVVSADFSTSTKVVYLEISHYTDHNKRDF